MFEFLGENRNLSCYMWRILLFLAYPEICMEREISKVVNLWKQIALFSTFYSIVAYKQYPVDKTQRMPEKSKPMIVFLKMQHAEIMANWNKIEYKCSNTLFRWYYSPCFNSWWKRYSTLSQYFKGCVVSLLAAVSYDVIQAFKNKLEQWKQLDFWPFLLPESRSTLPSASTLLK